MRRGGQVFPEKREDEEQSTRIQNGRTSQRRSDKPRANPENPRRTAAPKAMDEQLVASVRAIGIIQPPRVKEIDGGLVIIAGGRRVTAAITAGLTRIDVLVCDADEATDAMRSMSENLVRCSMSGVDVWRATEALEAQRWNEQAIADALALPTRTIRRLKLLANLHPAMLDVMAAGSMANEDQLRIIAAAARDEQAQVWKKHRPKKGQDACWHEVARALARRRIPFAAARFDAELAHAHGVLWDEDLFAPAGEEGRTTTNVESFFGAQREWLQTNLPERGTLLPTDEYGRYQLPKKAEIVYGRLGKRDYLGHYIDPHSGEVRTIGYRMPELKKAGKPGKGSAAADASDDAPSARLRPAVTRKGTAMIGALRTDALHQALREAVIDDRTLLALLVLGFGGNNVSLQSGSGMDPSERARVCNTITAGGVLTTDPDLLRRAARDMLIGALSCRDNMSDSGAVARIAGEAIGAVLHLPNMATEAFLSCLSKAALEEAAAAEGVRIEARGKDTRARLVERFKDGLYVYPGGLFKLTEDELAKAEDGEPPHYGAGAGAGWTSSEADGGGEDGEAGGGEPCEDDGGAAERLQPGAQSDGDPAEAGFANAAD